MLLNIAPNCVEYSKRMLTLLCSAKRPLTVPELVDGIAVELGDSPKFNPSRRLETVDAIHDVCPGFIEIDEQPSGGVATVRIAHFSVQEYLESERILRHEVAKFNVRKRQAHADIACICLTYLLEPVLLTSANRKREYPLAFYAAKTWHEHLRDGDESRNHVQRQTLRLFQNTAEFENWVNIWNVDDHYYGRKPTGKVPSPIYYASLLGLDLLLSNLLGGNAVSASLSSLSVAEVSRTANTQGGEYGNPLQAASARGHEAVVRLLLEKDVDVNAEGGYYGTALQAASAGGHEAVVRLLFGRNADVHVQGGEYGNALYAASARGCKAIVQLILERNADVDAIGGEYGNALYVASARGYDAIVRLLLEKKADVNAQGRSYGTALYAASSRGHETIVRMLLERSADVNVQGGEYGNALQVASARGYETIVQLLLESGANASAQGGFYGSALQAASVLGHERIVRLIQERGGGRQDSRVAVAASAQVESPPRTSQSAVTGEYPDTARILSRGSGAVGLGNLGNTGYMNTVLQCMRSVEELTKYFRTGEYAKDINRQNPLGYRGKVGIAYGRLLNDMYNTSNDTIRPYNFRYAVMTCFPKFASQDQRDSQEFLGTLLDALEQDLSRVKRRVYIEKPESTDEIVHDEAAIAKMADEVWNIMIRRDESVISDLFMGLFKSTLKCLVCGKIAIHFDNFNNLTLILPVEDPWANSVKFYPLNDHPVRIGVEIPRGSDVGVLKQFISDRTGVPVGRLIGAEEFRGKFYRIYDDTADVLDTISSNDIPVVHELEMEPSNWPLKRVARAKQQQNARIMLELESSVSNEDSSDDARCDHMVVPVLHRRGNKQTRTSYLRENSDDNSLPPHFIVLSREEVLSLKSAQAAMSVTNNTAGKKRGHNSAKGPGKGCHIHDMERIPGQWPGHCRKRGCYNDSCFACELFRCCYKVGRR